MHCPAAWMLVVAFVLHARPVGAVETGSPATRTEMMAAAEGAPDPARSATSAPVTEAPTALTPGLRVASLLVGSGLGAVAGTGLLIAATMTFGRSLGQGAILFVILAFPAGFLVGAPAGTLAAGALIKGGGSVVRTIVGGVLGGAVALALTAGPFLLRAGAMPVPGWHLALLLPIAGSVLGYLWNAPPPGTRPLAFAPFFVPGGAGLAVVRSF